MLSLILAALALAPIDAALASPTLRGAHVGILAVDSASGAVLYERNADDDFLPASNFKLLTGSAALTSLGPAFVFTTDVDAAGSIAGGTLRGDLYLRGGGDAQLAPADLDAAAVAVVAGGVRRIEGSLVADATRYDAPHYAPGWAVDDVPYEFAAIPSALSLELGVAHLYASPGDRAGAPAALALDPPSTAFQLENATTTGASGSEDTTDLERPWDRPSTIRVVGSYPLGAPRSDDLEPAVPDPAAYALDVFRQALERHGVSVAGGTRNATVPAGATILWTHRSKPLAQILADCWLPSRNVLAEQMLEELGAGGAGSDTRARGIAAEQRWLQSIGVDPATVTIADGSGLSQYDRIAPRALVAILQAGWQGPQRAAILAALPVAGESGTLRGTFTEPPLAGNVWAKTGTTNHSRLLSGFLRDARGRFVTFSLLINDWMDTSPHAMKALDAARASILAALATGD